MNLSSFSASFSDYELSLDYYHGKDILHQGCLLKIDADYSWKKINAKIRNKIRKAQKLAVTIKRVMGTTQDIEDFRTVWFDPDDVTIPQSLEDNEIMYLAYLDNKLVGGLILSPSSQTVLYMHNLGANAEGKSNNIPSLLLWHAVEDLEVSDYNYIDVGVSFRPTLYAFFKNFQTDSYPIIFNPPFIRPDIRLTPFENHNLMAYAGAAPAVASQVLTEYFGETFTILPRAIYCLKAILQHVGVGKDDNVAVFKTFANDYISRCVTEPIEACSTLSRKITAQTKAVVVIHEFGWPCTETLALKHTCQTKGIPLIEDCAWGIGSRLDASICVGDVGDYAIFSLPKILPLQYGAILKGLSISDEDNWNQYKLLDFFKRELVVCQLQDSLLQLPTANAQRRNNWHYLAELFKRDGFPPFAELPGDVYPGALIVKLDNLTEIFERYTAFGVESGRYYPEGALFLPVHQSLSTLQMDYIYGVFRGTLNLSSTYRRDSKST